MYNTECSNKFKKTLLASAVASSMALASNGSFAQDDAEAAMLILEEVVVSARKISETLQDVPQSIAVTKGDVLREFATTTLESLTDGTPTITVTRTPLDDAIFIRGVGSGVNPGFQQSVGTFIDGVYRGRSAASRGALFDVDRIEVLRGPQPVYFGNSTIGGAFNIISRDPGDELEVNLRTSYEFNAQESVTEIGVGGSITDTVGLRVATLYTDSKGWMEDTTTAQNTPEVNNLATRATLKFEPTESFDATLKVEYSDNEEEGASLQRVNCNAQTNPATYGPTCNPGVFSAPGFEDELDYNLARGGVLPNGLEQTDTNYLESLTSSLVLNYGLAEDMMLTSVTGYIDYTNDRDIDADVGPTAFLQAQRDEEFDQISQEFRLNYAGDNGLSYMVGVYYDKSDLFFSGDPMFGALGAPGSGLEFGARVDSSFDQTQESLGIFGSVAYDLTDRLTLTLGARWSQVEIDARHLQSVTTLDGDPASPLVIGAVRFGPLQSDQHDLSGSRKDTDVNPSIELQFEAAEDIMVYGSYKEGFKTGGFDANIALAELAVPTELDPNGGFEFEDETATAFEIGTKMKLLGNRLSLNIAAFRTEFSDLQTSTFDSLSGTFITGNAAKSVSQGVELDATSLLTDNLILTFSGTYLDSTYSDFEGAQCNAAQNAAFVPAGPSDRCTASLDGETTPNAPEFSGSLGLRYNYQASDNIAFFSSAQINYTDSFFGSLNPDDVMIQDAYTKINARIGLSGNDGQWEVSLFGKNLTDEVTFRQYFISETGGDIVQVDRARQVGLQLVYNYF